MSMTNPITINGATIPWQEAEKVAAEVAKRKAAQPPIEEGRLYWAPNDGSDRLCRWRLKNGEYRMSSDGGATWPCRWSQVDSLECPGPVHMAELTTTHYTILPRYTIEGVE